MDDLVQFLRDRLTEDEQAARAAMWDEQSDAWTARPPQATYERYTVVDYCDDGVVAVTPENADDDGVGQHIARHDPARVLRDVEAKRTAIDQCAYWNERAAHEAANPPKHPQPGLDIGLLLDAMNPVLRALALPYADHPDYRPAWRP